MQCPLHAGRVPGRRRGGFAGKEVKKANKRLTNISSDSSNALGEKNRNKNQKNSLFKNFKKPTPQRSRGREFQVKGMASAKALRQEGAWHTQRPLRLQQNKPGQGKSAVGGEAGKAGSLSLFAVPGCVPLEGIRPHM